MPIYKKVNKDFFSEWSQGMAYVLGFIVADGCLIKNNRGAYFLEFHITDLEILENIRNLMNSEHKISCRKNNKGWSPAYRLQIGNKKIFDDLVSLGLKPRKSKDINFPIIPDDFLASFIRGYFDGDGNVWSGYIHKNRKKPHKVLFTTFTSCSNYFIKDLANKLKKASGLIGGSLRWHSRAFDLSYSTNDSIRLYNFMYSGNNCLYLRRKKAIFEEFTKEGFVV